MIFLASVNDHPGKIKCRELPVQATHHFYRLLSLLMDKTKDHLTFKV